MMSFQTPEDNLFRDNGPGGPMQQIFVAMIRVDSKLDNVTSRLNELITQIAKQHDDHEGRIRRLEERPYVAPATVWKVIGALTGILGTIAGFISILR